MAKPPWKFAKLPPDANITILPEAGKVAQFYYEHTIKKAFNTASEASKANDSTLPPASALWADPEPEHIKQWAVEMSLKNPGKGYKAGDVWYINGIPTATEKVPPGGMAYSNAAENQPKKSVTLGPGTLHGPGGAIGKVSNITISVDNESNPPKGYGSTLGSLLKAKAKLETFDLYLENPFADSDETNDWTELDFEKQTFITIAAKLKYIGEHEIKGWNLTQLAGKNLLHYYKTKPPSLAHFEHWLMLKNMEKAFVGGKSILDDLKVEVQLAAKVQQPPPDWTKPKSKVINHGPNASQKFSDSVPNPEWGAVPLPALHLDYALDKMEWSLLVTNKKHGYKVAVTHGAMQNYFDGFLPNQSALQMKAYLHALFVPIAKHYSHLSAKELIDMLLSTLSAISEKK